MTHGTDADEFKILPCARCRRPAAFASACEVIIGGATFKKDVTWECAFCKAPIKWNPKREKVLDGRQIN